MASAVPHDPAPSTATGASAGARPPLAVSVGDGRLCLAGGVQCLEVHRRQQKLREAALADELRYRAARVRKQHPGTDGADRALQVLFAEAAGQQQPRLLLLDQE